MTVALRIIMAALKLTLALLAIIITTVASAPSDHTPASASSGPICNSDNCKIEDGCRCISTDVPGGLAKEKTPQMIFISFDGALTDDAFKLVTKIAGKRKNPNGCYIRFTIFVSHEYTSYYNVNKLTRHRRGEQGHELASNSITKNPEEYYWMNISPQVWKNEMVGMNNFIQKYARVTDKIKGMRAPYYFMGGDNMFEMASNNDFLWDNSWSTQKYSLEPIWPYTLDFNTDVSTKADCDSGWCPKRNYPKFWEVPLVDLYNLNNTVCINPASCLPHAQNEDEVIQFMESNFKRFYEGTRAPFSLSLSFGWLQQLPGTRNFILSGFIKWLDAQLAKDDVYVVTISQGLEWIRNPTELEIIKKGGFDPWTCSRLIPNHCLHALHCSYYNTSAGGERDMTSCIACPKNYPWITTLP